ncbi:putative reverse transcriptase domain-containing protein, partial [Tanacetum coccineum]
MRFMRVKREKVKEIVVVVVTTDATTTADKTKEGLMPRMYNLTAACRCLDKKDVTCFNCNEKGHLKRDCPTLKKNGQGGNNRGAVYKLGAVDAQQDPKVVT